MSAYASPTKTSLSASKVTELKALCSKNGLNVSGNKNELVNRLLTHFETVQTSSSPRVPMNKDLAPSSTSTTTIQSAPSKPPPVIQPEPPRINTTEQTAQSVKQLNADSNQTHHQVTEVPETLHPDPTVNEIEKQQQRAQRFGLATQNGTDSTAATEDEIKKLNRAKRFGISNEVNPALDKPLADGKGVSIKSVADLEWEARKRKRAEKFGLVDNPPVSNHKDVGLHRKTQKLNSHRPKY